jgi:C_GCAxxG_C_C family probable redox protein
MKTTEDKAIESFRAGLNCAQSVVSSYSDTLNFDNKLALKLSCGFGAGMGRLQETCGAVTGAFMILGIYNCNKYSDNKERKNETYSMVQKYNHEFKKINGTTNCMSLIKCDLNTEEGQKFLHDNNLHETICEKCISDSVKIVNKLLAQ